MSNIVVLRPSLPLRSAQPRTKKIADEQRVIRNLSRELRDLRKVNLEADHNACQQNLNRSK